MKNVEVPRKKFGEILEKSMKNKEITVEEGKKLLEAEGKNLDALLETADELRKREVGDVVTYVVNRNINFTNVCENSCKFCAFNRPMGDPEAYTLSKEEVKRKTKKALEAGATEICFQGGINPALDLEDYLGYLRAIRDVSERIHIHAYSPEEIKHMSRKAGLPIEKVLQKLKEEGINTIPGTAAEVLVERVRKIICPNKIDTPTWEHIIKTAHKLDIPTTATLMYGHVETPKEIASHIAKIREIQKETDGFTEFVPLGFVGSETELAEKSDNLDLKDHLKVHAVARIMLSGKIKNIQASWVKMGPENAIEALKSGANDFSGTLIEENITRAAGGKFTKLSAEEIESFIKKAGRVPVERTTTYSYKANIKNDEKQCKGEV